ncbi:hypothetical protein BV133_1255 [Blastochloris viridis]|uniref:Uncharacterized protein n=1 Tax=Blastochloris viridis TaxID=1079 RepID=A0A182D0H0_BLAVI|nr:hypothetical protein BV133_1255 [Blastochloris viridis]
MDGPCPRLWPEPYSAQALTLSDIRRRGARAEMSRVAAAAATEFYRSRRPASRRLRARDIPMLSKTACSPELLVRK